MATTETNTELGKQIVEDAKRYVLYSWSVQNAINPYTYRCPAGHPDPCPVGTGAPHLEEILQYEGAHTVAAVILETVTGTNGIIVPPDGYLQSIREVCDRHGILLIADEVMAGFGRTGKWFAVDHWDVVPDIMTM